MESDCMNGGAANVKEQKTEVFQNRKCQGANSQKIKWHQK